MRTVNKYELAPFQCNAINNGYWNIREVFDFNKKGKKQENS